MKLIHCSDLHLDSKMETNYSPKLAQQRNHEICLSFERMVHFADRNDVSVILLCGDIFDSKRIRQTTVDFVMDIICRFPQIFFFYLRGNHDESNMLSSEDLPNNLKLFSNQWKYFRLNDLVIAGIEMDETNAESLYKDLKLDSDKTNIVMMHGQVSSENAVNNVNLSQLKGKNIDYLALGHVHSYQEKRFDHRGVYCYSGCLEGRGFDETGKKGFVFLDINPHSIQTQFVDFAYRHFHKIEFDISNHKKSTDVLKDLRDICSEIPKEDFVQISLLGNNTTGSILDVSFFENAIASILCYVKIYDKTTFTVDTPKRAHNTLQKEFIESVLSDPMLTDEEKNAILQIGLSAIQNEELHI